MSKRGERCIRWLLAVIIICGLYSEAGMWTAGFAFIVFSIFYAELDLYEAITDKFKDIYKILDEHSQS